MMYPNIQKATFISRPNRFIAHIEINGRLEICHVKNTGRCAELLLPGAEVYVQEFPPGKRKTNYDLIAVKKGARLINMDSQAPNRVFYEWAKSGNFLSHITKIQPEYTFFHSRFDFYLEYGEKKALLEVKGATLEENGVVLFPDAPTERGVKHIKELIRCKKEGFDAWIVFIIQMSDVYYFTPNESMHPEFAAALRDTRESGVNILVLDCIVTENSITANNPVPIMLHA